MESNYDMNDINFEPSTNISVKTSNLLMENLWEKIEAGLTLADIENALFFILLIRFVILGLKYNLKTSFYITCIGFLAGYLWYRHFIDLISSYRSVLLKLPFLQKLGLEGIQLRFLQKDKILTDFKGNEQIHWYNLGQVLYYGVKTGIRQIDPETGVNYYIDPISMIISTLPKSMQVSILPLYYTVYNSLIPTVIQIGSKLWNQLSGIAAYILITRLGKRYCPYLIRWHWTLLLILGMVEQVFIYFVHRVYYFKTFVVLPQTNPMMSDTPETAMLQFKLLTLLMAGLVVTHLGFVLFGLFHAIWGQYFYLPFLVKNTELHVGSRPVKSLYSGGQTAWQDPEEQPSVPKSLFPKVWYGWFGRGTKDKDSVFSNWKIMVQKLKRFLKKIM